MFIERECNKYWKQILLLIFIFLTIPNLWLPELDHDEALYSLIAQEIVESSDFFNLKFQGLPTNLPPLLPWALTNIYNVMPVSEVSTRLPGILALGLLSLVCGYITFKSAGTSAAATTVAAAISSHIALSKGRLGADDMFFCLLINLSWLTWYVLSREKHRWLYSWFFAHLFVFLAFLTGGLKAIFFFYFPLIWLRRPLKIWLRLRQADHILSTIVLVSVLLIWFMMAPYQKEGVLTFFREFKHHEPTISYFKRFVLFPFQSVLSYLPWAFLAWPAYCMAFIPLEKDPVLGQFLRTIVISLFYFFWLTPEIRYEILTPLIGPLSIQIGLHYGILVRRYGQQLLLLPKLLAGLTVIGIVISSFVILMFHPEVVKVQKSMLVSSGFFLFLSISVSIIIIRGRLNSQVWLAVILSVTVIHLAFSTIYGVCTLQFGSEKRTLGRQLSERLPFEAVVHKMAPHKETLAGECFYIGHQVVALDDIKNLPIFEDIVFVLGMNTAPIAQNRHWTPVSKALTYGDYQLRMWKGERRVVEINPDQLEFRYDVQNDKYEIPTHNIQISHRTPKPLEIIKLESANGFLDIAGAGQSMIRLGERREFKIQVKPELKPDIEMHDTITIYVNFSNKILSRTINVQIKPVGNL